ncbi:unnamed protein product [Boreogadus saida]
MVLTKMQKKKVNKIGAHREERRGSCPRFFRLIPRSNVKIATSKVCSQAEPVDEEAQRRCSVPHTNNRNTACRTQNKMMMVLLL